RFPPVLQRLPGGAGRGRQGEQGQGGADPVLVPHRGGDGVAERLLVPEHEPRAGHAVRGPDDPLEAGERFRVPHLRRRRDLGQQGGRGRGRRDQPGGRLRTGGPVQQVSTQQPADLVTGERAPAAGGGGIRDRDGEPVAVRVVRDDQVRGGLARLRQGQI